MKKKNVINTIITCTLSLVIGIAIGLGINETNLFGFAAPSDIRVTNDGFYLVNGQKMDLNSLMLELEFDQTNELDRQIEEQLQEINSRDEMLREANDILATMRILKVEGRPMSKEVSDWFTANGQIMTIIPDNSDKEYFDQKWDENIYSIKGFIDGLVSESQLNLIRMQSLMDSRNQRYEQENNTFEQGQKTRDSIVENN